MSWQIINVLSMFLEQLAWPVVILVLGWRLCSTGRIFSKAIMASVLAITQEVAKK